MRCALCRETRERTSSGSCLSVLRGRGPERHKQESRIRQALVCTALCSWPTFVPSAPPALERIHTAALLRLCPTSVDVDRLQSVPQLYLLPADPPNAAATATTATQGCGSVGGMTTSRATIPAASTADQKTPCGAGVSCNNALASVANGNGTSRTAGHSDANNSSTNNIKNPSGSVAVATVVVCGTADGCLRVLVPGRPVEMALVLPALQGSAAVVAVAVSVGLGHLLLASPSPLS